MGGVAISDFPLLLDKRYRGAVLLESRQARWYLDNIGYSQEPCPLERDGLAEAGRTRLRLGTGSVRSEYSATRSPETTAMWGMGGKN
jgi:hypothetical protein